MTQTGLLANATPKVIVQVEEALFPVVTRPMPFEPVMEGLVPHADTASREVLVETIEFSNVWTPVHAFASPTRVNAAQVDPPAAEMVVTAWPAEQAAAPP